MMCTPRTSSAAKLRQHRSAEHINHAKRKAAALSSPRKSQNAAFRASMLRFSSMLRGLAVKFERVRATAAAELLAVAISTAAVVTACTQTASVDAQLLQKQQG